MKDTWSGNTIHVTRHTDKAFIVVEGPRGGHKWLIEVDNTDAELLAQELTKKV